MENIFSDVLCFSAFCPLPLQSASELSLWKLYLSIYKCLCDKDSRSTIKKKTVTLHTHSLSVLISNSISYPFGILLFPPCVYCMHIYGQTPLSKSRVKMSSAARRDCMCEWKYDNFMHNLSSDIPSSISVLLLSGSRCQRLKCLTLRVH